MKRILPIALCFVLILGVLVVPASAIEYDPDSPANFGNGPDYEFWDGYTYGTYITDSIGQLWGLKGRLENSGKTAFITYSSTNGVYMYFDDTNVWDSLYGVTSLNDVEQYYFQDGTWVYVDTKSTMNVSSSSVKWASADILTATGSVLIYGDPNFRPVPLAEQIQGVAEEQLTGKTLPALGETVLTIVTIAVGCLALLISLVILVRVLRMALVR